LGLIILYATGVRAAYLTRPFPRDVEGVASYFGILARDYFRFGIQHFGVPIQSLTLPPATPRYYANHPPLVPLLVAAVYGICGYRGGSEHLPADWMLRLPTSIFTVGCVALIFFILRKRAGVRPAAIAAFVFAAMPMTIYFGAQADVINTQLNFFI